MLTHLGELLNKGRTVLLAERPGGLPAMAAPKSGLAAASKLALWPGYGLGHDDERQNQENGPVKSEKDPPIWGGQLKRKKKL